MSYNAEIFTRVNKYIVSNSNVVSYTGILIASKLNQKNGRDYPILDAIDIDWNGAWIDSLHTYLYTTEDLIRVLDYLNRSNEVGDLNREIQEIWKQIREITSTYVTYSYLESYLSEYYQEKLVLGNFIGINENNVVYAYGLPTYEYLKGSYATLTHISNIYDYLDASFYDKEETNQIAYQSAYNAIMKVIDGADNAFDTLKEIADWILDQNRYTPVDYDTVINDWKDNYYYYLDEDGKYKIVESLEWAQQHPNVQYYIQENYLTDIQNLIKRVDRLDSDVGYALYNEKLNIYTYTGFHYDIHDLYNKHYLNASNISQLYQELSDVETKAEQAYQLSHEAIDTANDAYSLAYTALTISYDTTELAYNAYNMAYESVIAVGHETKKGGFTKIESEEQLNQLVESGKNIYIKNLETDTYEVVAPPYDFENVEYYWVAPYEIGTGLTKRVEDVEVKANEAKRTAEEAQESANKSLYYLNVDNSKSTYVKLSLHPSEYLGSRERVINVKTDEAQVNSKTGEISHGGLVNIATAFDIYTYASSWMMLYVDSDVNFEDILENNSE